MQLLYKNRELNNNDYSLNSKQLFLYSSVYISVNTLHLFVWRTHQNSFFLRMKRKKAKNAVVQKMSHSRNLSVILYAPEEIHEGSAVILCMVYKALSVSFTVWKFHSFWCIAIRENTHRRTHVHTDILNIRFCVYLMIPDVLTHSWSFWK